MKYDCSGWATKNDLKCSDGRTIRKDAFKDDDGLTVPLVWNHQHGGVENVLGHALLENREEGVYTYATFNDTAAGQNAKQLVQHGDVKSFSIYANKLKQRGGDVIHGAIKEVSLVLAGANPGATIDTVLEHSEFDDFDEEAIMHFDSDIELYHAEEEKEMANEQAPSMMEKFKKEFTPEQQEFVYMMVGAILEKEKGGNNKEEGDAEMKHNVFSAETDENVISHAEMATIIGDAKRAGSLKESFLMHAEEYGIENIEWLFPDARNLTEKPGFIKRNPDGWVATVMNGTHHSPFSRIKMMFADLREDDARAKGYQKGKLKKEEVFGLLRRTVEPTTIYKKQKLDRDDIIDITDFDVVSWLKGEMRMMLDEEIARAILFGDGRSALSDDKISETNIIPICKDAALYNIQVEVTGTPGTDAFAKDMIRQSVKGQDEYEGSGDTTLFTAAPFITDMLLLEDADGHRMYKDTRELALAMNVDRIVKVPASIIPEGIYGVIVDLKDYNVGADKGGSINMFDDFDIDYNQQKYLIETRCSGALYKPYSAITLKKAE